MNLPVIVMIHKIQINVKDARGIIHRTTYQASEGEHSSVGRLVAVIRLEFRATG